MQLTRRLPDAAMPAPVRNSAARALYFALLETPDDPALAERAARFLHTQLEAAAALPCDLPASLDALDDWLLAHTEAVGRQYRAYLEQRRGGAARRYFSGKAHAQHFLRGVAPTKLVDGAWLYGLLAHWQDGRFTGLIQTYLEELGEGLPEKNHVVLYRKLLASQGCDDWQGLDDEHFVQGAIQLALAANAERFLPELIGFNLGYEQLPLHLLITSFELAELGIDPYYFTLHVTVDNADSGHAKKAVQALRDAWPQVGDAAAFQRRVLAGYRLNGLGASTLSVIEDFDVEQEVLRVLEKKSGVGQFVHSDYCRFDGRSVNQWLAEPALVAPFLETLQRRGWIRRHQDPQESRFWQLVCGEQAPMFGVFSSYEQQLIHDWIAGDWLAGQRQPRGPLAQRQALFASRRRASPAPGSQATRQPDSDFDSEARALERQLAQLPDRAARMRHLLPLLAPSRHHGAAGLLATRIFNGLFNH